MKSNFHIILYLFKIIYIFLITINYIKCNISYEEIEAYFQYKTIDRMRQIYWNIVVDVNSKTSDSLGQALQKQYVEDNLHTLPRSEMVRNLAYSLFTLNRAIFYYYLDINKFRLKMNEIDLFSTVENAISIEKPKNFLVNFAINIDKYERMKNRQIDGISDYINFYTKEQVLEYINRKLAQYEEIKKKFKIILLNDISLNYNSILEYVQSKQKEELYQLIYGCENYIFNGINPTEVYTYERYIHEDFYSKSDEDLAIIINFYQKEAGITKIDDFMYKIENRNFEYISIDTFFYNKEKELSYNLLALEKYYKRQMNLTKSLRGINDYTKNMPSKYQKRTLAWGLTLFPELYESGRFQDIISNEINYQYGQVKELVQIKERNTLLKYVYNIHTYQYNIKSIYDDELFNLYRFKNEKIIEFILSDTNLNRNLQVKTNFINFSTLHKDIFCKYLENLERNQLKKIVLILIDLYFKGKESYEIPSEKLSRIEYAMNSDTPDLLYEAENFVNSTTLEIQQTSKFFESNKNLIAEYINNTFGYYYNLMDFLRSTDIFYLKLWARKYEAIIRRKKLYSNIEGGLNNNFLNENTKKDILGLFDIYLEEYPELFTPKKFIEIIELNNDITPHKQLVELFENKEKGNNKEIIMRIAYSLTGHYQRKNIQTSFNVTEFLNELNISIYTKDDKTDKYVFQLFRIINIFPELINSKIFEKICINNDTRVISVYEKKFLEKYYKRDMVQICKNIQYYLNQTNNYDNKDIEQMKEIELMTYISDFTVNHLFFEDYDLQSRILDGDFYPIIYDYYENYLNNIDEEHFLFIYDKIKEKCSEKYPCQNISNSTDLSDRKKEIINDIKNIEEFQNPNFFDKYFDYISERDGDELYEYLVNTTNKDLKLFTITANIIKIEALEKNETINKDSIPDDIYFKINYMSRNEMIRYILSIREIKQEMITSNMLPILIKYYKLDIGSDNIYDLTLY